MKVLDLFSGIGGFTLGLESTGYYRTVAFCEIDPFCQRVLGRHWPDIPIYKDVHHVSGKEFQVDVITGGFPCQPVSLAGKGKGKKDKRWLWPELNRIIGEAQPAWCIIENVPGLRTRHADEVLADLEGQGYTCWPLVVGALHAGAPHRRQRVWIVAHADNPVGRRGGQERRPSSRGAQSTRYGDIGAVTHADSSPLRHEEQRMPSRQQKGVHDQRGSVSRYDGSKRTTAYAHRQRLEKHAGQQEHSRQEQSAAIRISRAWNWRRAPQPIIRRMDDGLPTRLHRRARLTALGNAVVPQIVATIGRSIYAVAPP